MKGVKNKKQHFIPQCYLKCFSENDKSIWIYNKNCQKVYSQSISKTAFQDDFYKIPEKYISSIKNDDFDPNFFEKEFFDSNVEKLFGRFLRIINRKAGEWITDRNLNIILPQNDKDIFAAMIAIQYLRMPNIRDEYTSLYEKSASADLEIIKAFTVNQYPENKEFIDSIQGEYDNDYNAIVHSDIFSDQVIINNIQDDILNKIWIFYVSESKDFYTSDNPILIKPHLENQCPYNEGFGMRGGEVIFPIGHSVLLTLWDKEFFKNKYVEDNKFQSLDDKSKRQYNLYQYIWANGEVYSHKNNFDLIEKFKQENGGKDVFMERPKVLVNGK